MKRVVLTAGLIGTAILLVVIYVLATSRPSVPLQEGEKAPNFKLEGAFGGEGSLSDMRGKVVLLNFWATWCAPCVQEMPSLQKLYTQYEGDDFEILAVSLDQEGAPVVRNFAERYKLSFALVVDPKNVTSELYHLTGLPETYLIDKEGKIVKKYLGPEDWASNEKVALIADLLGHGPRAAAAPVTATTLPNTGASAPATSSAP